MKGLIKTLFGVTVSVKSRDTKPSDWVNSPLPMTFDPVIFQIEGVAGHRFQRRDGKGGGKPVFCVPTDFL